MAKRRKDGYLESKFTYNGKRYTIYGKNKQELIDKEIRKRKELESGLSKLFNPTLKDYYEQLANIRRRELQESTIRAQQSQFTTISNVSIVKGLTFGEIPIKDITRRDIENVRSILLSQGKTPQNLNNCFAHLNHVFACAVIDETISKNPCKALKQLKRTDPAISENKHRALTIEETQRFFEKAKERNSFYINAFDLMLKTGMRVGELTALTPFEIDRKEGFIHIKRTITRNEAGAYYVGENAKTKSGIRDIPLTDEMYNIIRDQINLNKMVYDVDTNSLIFKSVEGEILREYTLNREIKRICALADIDYFTCHAFRNTFATRFIEQRPQDYKILSEILGHKDISITLDLYTHVMTENKVNAMNELYIKTV